jgi:hypothetical protein
MVVGDIIIGQGAVNTVLTFQPAAGVEIMLTAMGGLSSICEITDGAVVSLINPNPPSGSHLANEKVGINNTYYLSIRAVAAYGNYYTGIQIK